MSNKKFIKKIVAGRFKGKVLELPSKTTTRSSKTIVLESFFNTIQFEIIDANFVEVFSGSGSVGLEALSRGAKKVYFMEKDRDALKVLKRNIAQTEPAQCEVLGGDSFVNITTVVGSLKRSKEKAFFYVDPPFSFREGMEEIYDKTIELIAALPVEVVKLITLEHMTGLDLPQNIGPYTLKKSKKFGKTTLTYYSSSSME